jgi:hypothetical protein
MNRVRNQREVNEVNKLILNLISDELKNLELEIMDDIAGNCIPIDVGNPGGCRILMGIMEE